MNNTSHIYRAKAIYTGGGIWLFYGELDDGNYFLTDDNGFTYFLNADPSNLDESTYYEWQVQHLVREVHYEEREEFCDELLDYIFTHPDDDGGMTEYEIAIYRDYFQSEDY